MAEPGSASAAANGAIPVRAIVLGSGTSTGVPVIGCECRVCKSDDPRNKRLRTSILIEVAGKTLLVDCGVDFRQQMLRRPTPTIDAVLVTHAHADHVHGIDDLRAYTLRQRHAMPLYSAADTLEDLRYRFRYMFEPVQKGGGIVRLDLREVRAGVEFEFEGVRILPLGFLHGRVPILGFRIGDFAYLTDCSFIPEETYELLAGVRTAILTGLRREPHPTHFSVDQSVEAGRRMGVERLYLIHMTCRLDHAETEASLPDWVRLTYDGMEIEA